MRLRNWIFTILLGIGLLLGTVSARAQRAPSDVTIQTIPLHDGIYMLVGDGGNLAVSAGDDGVFMVDDQFAALTQKLKEAIADISDKPVKYVVNTHWHFDHVGGNENFARDGAIIVAHDNVRKRMATEQFIEAFQRKVPPSPAAALPTLTFFDGTSFHMNGQNIGVQHIQMPSHTDGDSLIYFEEANILHTGDLYFNGRYPFIDYSSEGSIGGMINAVEKILAFTDDQTQIIPGHGPLSNKQELQTYLALLQEVQGKVTNAIASGMSLEDFIASKPTAQYDATWGQSFLNPQAFLTIVYQGEEKQHNSQTSSSATTATHESSASRESVSAVKGLF